MLPPCEELWGILMMVCVPIAAFDVAYLDAKDGCVDVDVVGIKPVRVGALIPQQHAAVS